MQAAAQLTQVCWSHAWALVVRLVGLLAAHYISDRPVIQHTSLPPFLCRVVVVCGCSRSSSPVGC